jgi:rubrerythrin
VIQDLTVWANQLIRTLQDHMDTERDALREYGQIAEQATDEHVRFLVKMILDDEVRHHGLFADMINSLRAEMGQSDDGGLPAFRRTHDREALLAKTNELLGLEKEDVKELQSLRKEISRVADTRWWSVIVDTMEMDNLKHIKLLEFIRDHA